MRTSKLQKFVWVFFALALGTTTVFAQGWRNGNRVNNSLKGTCLEQISGLTNEQKTQIQEMEKSHQIGMAELRNSRRTTVDAIGKNEIRSNMLKVVKSHQTAVINLLSEEQQNQYTLLHVRSNNYGNNKAGRQQFAKGNRGRCRGTQAGFEQRNQRNNRGCQNNNNNNNNNKRGNRGNGSGNNPSNS